MNPPEVISLSVVGLVAALLSVIDGHATVEMLLDVSSSELARDNALGILAHLLQLGAVELREP
jgi:hypothetical protein